jgi:hypothetical protein
VAAETAVEPGGGARPEPTDNRAPELAALPHRRPLKLVVTL